MSKQRFEYKVAFVDFRGRVSIEGEETLIKDGERMTAFGRRYLNALGEQGWELIGVQTQPMGNAFHIFRRPLAEGEQPEPAKPIEQAEPQRWERPVGAYPAMHPFPGPQPFDMWFQRAAPPPMPPYPAPPGDVLVRFVRRGPGDPEPHEFNPPAP
jgi:hypothetical protein